MEMVQESAKDLRIPRASIHRVEADGVTMFYREAGPSDAPALLLPHGFPTSLFQYRELIPRAEAFRRDNPNAVVQLLDTGHFALETHVEEVALATRQFLAKVVP